MVYKQSFKSFDALPRFHDWTVGSLVFNAERFLYPNGAMEQGGEVGK